MARTGKRKKQPERLCLICRQLKERDGLLRIVRAKDGSVRLDPAYRLPGRGYYVCVERACLEPLLSGPQLARRLQLGGDSESLEELRCGLRERLEAAEARRAREAEEAARLARAPLEVQDARGRTVRRIVKPGKGTGSG
ncbi:MAG: YlxR family protein [Bacillota bacterium]|nr:YlxR family protein [Bacillota bacterium]